MQKPNSLTFSDNSNSDIFINTIAQVNKTSKTFLCCQKTVHLFTAVQYNIENLYRSLADRWLGNKYLPCLYSASLFYVDLQHVSAIYSIWRYSTMSKWNKQILVRSEFISHASRNQWIFCYAEVYIKKITRTSVSLNRTTKIVKK